MQDTVKTGGCNWEWEHIWSLLWRLCQPASEGRCKKYQHPNFIDKKPRHRKIGSQYKPCMQGTEMSGVLICTSWPMEKNQNVHNGCSLSFGFVIKAYTSETMWKTWLQEEGYRQKHPKYFLLYSSFFKYYMRMLQASRICYNPEGWCKKRKRQEHIATVLRCGKNTVHELSLVGSQIPALKELWLVVLHLLRNFSQVRMSTDHVLTGVPFWQLFRCNED